MKHYILSIFALLAMATVTTTAQAKNDKVNQTWQNAVLQAVEQFPQGGGYYTGRKATADFPKSAWRAMNEAFNMKLADQRPDFKPERATPSFCSMATYAALIQALVIWDKEGAISRNAWFNIKPLVGITDGVNQNGVNQSDGMGCWGRANANGPGIAVLVNDLKAGFSFTAYRGAKSQELKESSNEQYLTSEQWNNHEVWSQAKPGDFMKIFWDRNESHGSDSGAVIGVDGNTNAPQEHGHSVIFLGYTPEGEVKYWSSNGPTDNPTQAGYSIATCPKDKIQRVVFTRIINPENFNNAKKLAFNNTHKWLKALNGERHGTTAELKKYCGIK
ncbi:MAG: hypothetical protein ACI308_07220 [Muribaculaceae bacterium]